MALTKEQLEYQRAYRVRNNTVKDKPGVVYLVGTSDFKQPVKIGWTGRDMAIRLSEMQMENPHELKVLFTSKKLRNANKVERKIHEMLAESGKHIRGEWFELNKYQRNKLKEMLK